MHAGPRLDGQRMPAGVLVLKTGLRDFNVPARLSVTGVDAQVNHGVGNVLFKAVLRRLIRLLFAGKPHVHVLVLGSLEHGARLGADARVGLRAGLS